LVLKVLLKNQQERILFTKIQEPDKSTFLIVIGKNFSNIKFLAWNGIRGWRTILITYHSTYHFVIEDLETGLRSIKVLKAVVVFDPSPQVVLSVELSNISNLFQVVLKIFLSFLKKNILKFIILKRDMFDLKVYVQINHLFRQNFSCVCGPLVI